MTDPDPAATAARVRTAVDLLEGARRALAIWILLVVLLSGACFAASERILGSLLGLLGRKLVAYDPSEPFLTLLSLSFFGGLFLSVPAAAWMLWRGISARFFPQRRRLGSAVVLAATLLFAGGAILCWRVLLPAGIGFLVGFEDEGTRAFLSARTFVSFVGTMLLALGLAFEMPLFAFFLARAGILTPGFFRRRWRHAVLASTVAAAVITPTPDVYNLTLMAAPLLALYFVSFGVTLAAYRERRRADGD
jgi:sec-independent protein translocase protein TatC